MQDVPSKDISSERFEIPIAVNPSDIDRLGHVNNVVYVRWVQDAAVAHWKALATPEQQSDILWVVVRHEIEYKRSAQPDDEIVARTWVGKAGDLRFERHTEILRARDQKVLAQAMTLWCPINPKTGKPTRVPPDVRARFSVANTPADSDDPFAHSPRRK